MKYLAGIFIMLVLFVSCSGDQDKSATNITTATETPAQQAEQLFKINCMQCHLPGKDFAGPALAGVRKRWPNKALLYEFIKDPQAVIAKDDYAAGLFEKWKQAPMNPAPHLSNEEIDAILDYCDSQVK
jgi:cytochrome c551/c552